ncbi:Tetratricopeptide repeat-containing protein [Mucilaginibacter gossypiicola]|uniref:Tetratricopeptide repeat-containing protein n=1 Tax=Mucilaginibacter gossypiicola TaxID=551995 RepID=A0A1H8DB38_9SPHI|nr:tetratricopeptide repeat protein [Mucilaginibacter gossypiicola]SEN04469.1 Tetratricopeptide repeat-containing protein [Mucilaginibacter gossypiicola]
MAYATFAQNSEIDSIERLLKNHALADSIKIKSYNELAFDYSDQDPNKGLEYADKAIALCQQLHDNIRLGTAYNYKALNYASLGKDSLAINCYRQAIRLAQFNGNKKGEGKALNNLAILYTNRAEYQKSLELRLGASAIFEEIHDQKAIGGISNNLGVTYLYLGDYPQALSSYFKALGIAQRLHDQQGQARALMNVGLVYKKLGNYKQTFRYYGLALNLFRQLGDDQQLAGLLANMGSAYDKYGDHQKALALFNQALAVNKKNKMLREQASNLTDIGVVYDNLKQYHLAYQYLQQALGLYKAAPDKNTLAVIYNELSGILLSAPDSALQSIGLKPREKYVAAEQYAMKAIKVSKQTGSIEREMNGWEALSTVHQQMKKYDKALSDYKKFSRLKDSIFNDEKRIEIERAAIQFEAGKKEALAQAAFQKEKVIKNAATAGLIIVLVASIALFVSYKKRRDALQAQKDLALQAKVNETETKVLRLQMNPHFIFNSLNAISNYMIKNDVKTADYFLSKFAGLMRGILENSQEKEISLADELKMTEMYMHLEAIRLNNKFSFSLQVDDGINEEDVLVPPLILQPFVENSIWHGLAPKKENGKIVIAVNSEQHLLRLTVTDDGVGRSNSENKQKRSLGVKITADRLALLNTFADNRMGIRIVDLDKGTRVEITLPYRTDTDT